MKYPDYSETFGYLSFFNGGSESTLSIDPQDWIIAT